MRIIGIRRWKGSRTRSTPSVSTMTSSTKISTMTTTSTTIRITEVGDFRATKGVMLQEPHFFLSPSHTDASLPFFIMLYNSISFHFRSDTHVQHVNTAFLSLTHTDSTLSHVPSSFVLLLLPYLSWSVLSWSVHLSHYVYKP